VAVASHRVETSLGVGHAPAAIAAP
jgi:hypothetical protein